MERGEELVKTTVMAKRGTWRRLRVLAAETDRQVSALVQEALEAFLERREREAAEGKKRKA